MRDQTLPSAENFLGNAPRGARVGGRGRFASIPGRYGVAIVGFLGALLIQGVLWPFLPVRPFLFFFLAIMVAGWWGGWGPALCCISLSVLAIHRFFLPPGHVAGVSPGDALSLGLFALISVLISWRNVTVRRFAAERLELLQREQAARSDAEAQRARLHTVLQDAPAHIALFHGPEHVYVLSNTQNAEFVAGREVVGKPLREAVPEAVAQGIPALLDRVYATGQPFIATEAALQLPQPDGTLREAFMNFIFQPVRDAEGRVDGVAAFAFDVTELVRSRKRAEDAEKSLQRLAESIPAIVWSAGADGVNDYYNRRWYEYTGIPPGSLDPELMFRACHPEDLAAILTRWNECLERGESFQGEMRVLRASDQTYRWHLVRTVPWKDASGRVAKWFGTSFDIDEQKRAEAALRESEARFRNMADHAPVMLWVTNAANQCTYFSRPWYAFTGRTEAESLGLQWLAAVHPEDVDAMKEAALAAVSLREPFHIDYRLRRADGEYRWVNGSASPRSSAAGEFLGYIGSIIDVTDRKRGEALLALLARAGGVLGTSLDETETLTAAAGLAVPAFADQCLVELRREDGTFQRVLALPASPEDAELACYDPPLHLLPDAAAPSPAAQVLLRGESLLIEDVSEHARWMRQAGLLSCIAVPLVARGSTLGVLAFLTSHSGRRYTQADKALAEELARRVALSLENARLYKRAQEAVRLRDEFLSVASHELKTPLTPLSLKLQVLARDAATQPDSPFSREVLAHVEAGRKQVRKLGALIGDLLDVSRISANRMKLAWEPMDFAAMVTEVAARHEAQALRAGTPLRVDVPESLKGTWDAMRLEQVVVNLLDNALKYGRGKPVRLRLTEKDGKAILTVQDEGIGIVPEAQERIFDRFVRAVSDRHYGGLGLGLYITKTLVEAMGGTIQVQSEPGRGATFTVVLPRSATGFQ
jgi:PAS domain S-box-containing protein